jgi:hypothetical protein
MDKVEIQKDFQLRGWFPKWSYNHALSVLRKFSSDKNAQASQLYHTDMEKDGPFRFGSIFNGEQYAELDYYKYRDGNKSDGFLSIKLYGEDKNKLDLIKKDLEKGLEEAINKNGS